MLTKSNSFGDARSADHGRYTGDCWRLYLDKGHCLLWSLARGFDFFDPVVVSRLVSEPSVTSYQFLFLSVIEF